jgi:hypothetical protein
MTKQRYTRPQSTGKMFLKKLHNKITISQSKFVGRKLNAITYSRFK